MQPLVKFDITHLFNNITSDLFARHKSLLTSHHQYTGATGTRKIYNTGEKHVGVPYKGACNAASENRTRNISYDRNRLADWCHSHSATEALYLTYLHIVLE